MMSIKKKLLAWSSAGLLVAGLGVAASTTPLTPTSSATAATAPSCLHTAAGSHNVTVTNTCKTYKRVKAIFSLGRDSTCYGLSAGSSVKFSSGKLSGFDRLETC
jgi:hypothetical protein